MRRAALLIAACTLALAGAAAARPAGGATDPTELLSQAVAAGKAASTVHMVGRVPDGKQWIAFNLRLRAGVGGAGTITIDGSKLGIIRIGKNVYLRAPASFWAQYGSKAVTKLLTNRWVFDPNSRKDFAPLVELTNISAFLDSFAGSHGKLVLGGSRTIRGQPAIGIVDTSKDGGTLWVRSQGTPYPLELTPPSGPGHLNFEQWNAALRVAAPPHPLVFH
jgi:hypothetical protein